MKNNKIYDLTITLIFLIAIFVPFITGIIQDDKKISTNEKRPLAERAKLKLNIEEIKVFPEQYSNYYADHFGMRELMVKGYKSIKYHIGDSPSPDVIIGKDGWLFLGSIKNGYTKYMDPIGDARNVNQYSVAELRVFATYMETLNAYLKEMDIKYIFVIAPNKHSIYFENLPWYISKQNEHSATDQLIDYLKSNTSVTVLDLRVPLLENKINYQLYFKTDTHWNHFGANIAQYTIMKEIERLFPGKILPMSYEVVKGKDQVGDLAQFLGLPGITESHPQPIFEGPSPKQTNVNETKKVDSWSCEGQELISLNYGDSFFNALKPYFIRKFGKSTFVRQRISLDSLKEQIQIQKPDIVIEEWVERTLPYTPFLEPEMSNLLKKREFYKNKIILFSSQWDQLNFNSQLIGDINGKELHIEAIDKDPIIYLPPLNLTAKKKYIIRIEFESSINSFLQVFFSEKDPKGYPFTPTNSMAERIKIGENIIYFNLEHTNIGPLLRLDPASSQGKIVFKSLEIREVELQKFD